MSTDPASTSQHAKGTVVNLTVSNGKVELPNVTQQPFSTANATLDGLGGLIGGLIAGAAAYWIGRIPTWRWLRGLMPVVIIPLFASIIASGCVVGPMTR
ncbi:hypothetical protein IAE22_32085 [Bacillus sp. S34]|nr:hypothetical protein [Bacillus sp. S34]